MFAMRLTTLFIGLFLAMEAFAAAPPVKGVEYALVEPVQPRLEGSHSKGVEVVEFFYYGCPHCYNLQPALKAWLKNPPKDIEYRRMPTVFSESWLGLTRTYYALEAVGALERLHDDVFTAVHQKGINLGDRPILVDWAARNGVDARKLEDALDSFTVNTKTQRSVQLTRAYGITGTPSMVVAGRYLTAPSMTLNGDHTINYQRFSEVLTALVEMARNAPVRK
jgi:thiol:disulfide interchange protein DsbA